MATNLAPCQAESDALLRGLGIQRFREVVCCSELAEDLCLRSAPRIVIPWAAHAETADERADKSRFGIAHDERDGIGAGNLHKADAVRMPSKKSPPANGARFFTALPPVLPI